MTITKEAALDALDLSRIPRDLPSSEYKLGDEFKPFHPAASHVPPEYRDGWNRCWLAARVSIEQQPGQDDKDAQRYRWLCDKYGVTKLPCAVERILDGTYVADGKSAIDAAIDAARQSEGKRHD